MADGLCGWIIICFTAPSAAVFMSAILGVPSKLVISSSYRNRCIYFKNQSCFGIRKGEPIKDVVKSPKNGDENQGTVVRNCTSK